MYRVGQYVYLNPTRIGKVDTQRGVVIEVGTSPDGAQYVSVFWERDGHNDGHWRSDWLLLV